MFWGFILLLISFCCIFTSTCFLTSVISDRNSSLGLVYFPILAFAQIVLTFEILSLFSAINQPCVLLLNFIFLVLTYKIWNGKGKPKWGFDREVINRFFIKIKNSLKLDKTLIVLLFCYLIFVLTALFLSIIMPVTSGDGKTYHVARSFFYVIQGNLGHFITNDIRALCLPFNSEILYAWVILFLKKDIALAMFSFAGYIVSIIATFNILGLLHFSYRRRLWVIFILSSFASVIVQASSNETDIIITAFVASSIFMFWKGLKTGKNIPVYMSALAYALAIGTKTPSIIMIPAVGFLMLTLCFIYKKFKPLFAFLLFGVLNFIVFSSYNYILNLIYYKNIAGPDYFMVVSKNYFGFKGACANFVKYIFMFFDFTGFKWSDYMMKDLLNIKDTTLAFLGLTTMQDGLYSTDSYFQRSLIEQVMGAGILGFLVFLPCWIFSLFKGFSKYKMNKKIFLFGVVMLINLLVISFSISYMSYSVRFVMEFIVISSPVLAYSYFSNKNPLKYIIIYFSIYYLACVSTHIWIRPIPKIFNILKNTHSISEVRTTAICKNFYVSETSRIDCKVRSHLNKYSKDNKILYIPESATNYVGLGKMILQGYQIDIAEPEYLSFIDKDLSDYDLIVLPAERQRSTVLNDYENRKNDCVVNFKTKVVKILKKRPYTCFYEYNMNIPQYDKKGELMSPFAVTCDIKPKFINDKGFYMSRFIGLQGAYDSMISNYYFFFQNIDKDTKLKN